MLKERVNAKECLLYPLKKVNGQLICVSWKETFDDIARNVRELKNGSVRQLCFVTMITPITGC
jgi:anaerobic selenocysteine-containing dehydrogenase